MSTPLTAGQLLTSDRSFSHPCRGEISPVAVGPRLSVTQKEPDAMGERRGEGRFTNYGRVGSPDLPTSGALFWNPPGGGPVIDLFGNYHRLSRHTGPTTSASRREPKLLKR